MNFIWRCDNCERAVDNKRIHRHGGDRAVELPPGWLLGVRTDGNRNEIRATFCGRKCFDEYTGRGLLHA